MSIYRRPGSKNWHYRFKIKGGHRFRGSCGTDDQGLAKAIEAKLRHDALLGQLTGKKPELTLDEAFGAYWLEVASKQPSADDTRYQSDLLLGKLGGGTRCSELTDKLVAGYVAGRSPGVSGATINRELGLLRRVLRRADLVGGAAVSMPNWSLHRQEEADERVRSLSGTEELRLSANMRRDYLDLIIFAALSGLRLMNCVELTWPQVNWDDMVLVLKVKSRKPGGKVKLVPITDQMAAILRAQEGRHSERVFTYVCQRNVTNRKTGLYLKAGARYPFTRNGWRKAWAEGLGAAKIADFRFHDLRHTFGTRLLAETGNIKLVQRALGHEDIKTTLRYLKCDLDDVRAGMSAMNRGHVRDTALPAPTVEVLDLDKKVG